MRERIKQYASYIPLMILTAVTMVYFAITLVDAVVITSDNQSRYYSCTVAVPDGR